MKYVLAFLAGVLLVLIANAQTGQMDKVRQQLVCEQNLLAPDCFQP